MFYSHSFLAKKRPLGTVWIAAHLERRLRKSHVSVTDIPSSVDSIMFPEIPMALRLSGHLLLGVVRIYSKKVDYLYRDCNMILNQLSTISAPVTVDPTNDANRATFQSVTLPDTFELDAMEIDDVVNLSLDSNNHSKPFEDITLPDDSPGEGRAYVRISLDEDNMQSSFPQLRRPSIASVEMEEDTLPPFPSEFALEISPERGYSSGNARQPSPVDHACGPSENGNIENNVAEVSPDTGVMRDVVHSPGPQDHSEFGEVPEDMFEQEHTTDPRKGLSLVIERLSASRDESLPFPPRQCPSVAASPDIPGVPEGDLSIGHSVPELAFQPSPPARKNNKRKRKLGQLFDETIVLTNVEMKKRLNNTSILVRKRKKLPCSASDIWKSQWKFQNEQLLQAPSISGMCHKLKETWNMTFPASRVEHIDVGPDIPTAQCPIETPHGADGIEHNADDVIGELSVQSPFQQTDFANHVHDHSDDVTVNGHSPVELPRFAVPPKDFSDVVETMNEQSPARSSGASLDDPHSVMETTNVQSLEEQSHFPGYTAPSLSEALPSPSNRGEMTPRYSGDLETISHNLEERLDQTNLPGTPILRESPVVDDLNFLELDGEPGSLEASEISNMSARTRAVAKYLKNQSPGEQLLTSQTGLCLNRILEGKLRKPCARMFMETLILKSNDIINVEQKEAYGDINITLTSKLLKMRF